MFIECARAALLSIRNHGFRSVLTTLGIIIGVASVIATIAMIQGLSRSIGTQFEGLGANSVNIRSHTSREQALRGRVSRLTNRDFEAVRDHVAGIESITPISYSRVRREIVYRSRSTFADLLGTRRAYQDVQKIYVQQGRFLSAGDERRRRSIAVIGDEVRAELQLPENPVGEFIAVDGEWVKIVGVMEKRGQLLGTSRDNYVLLPYSTMQSINGDLDGDIAIQLTVARHEDVNAVISEIAKLLREKRSLGAGEEDDFKVESAEELKKSIANITNTVTLVMAGIVGISLLVGGVGIMNVMLVSVRERTREIGICKAIGAKRWHVLLQFLLESSLLSGLGGLIGVVLGYGLGALLALAIPAFPPAHVPLWAIVLSVGVSATIGIVFGILPAAQAANLDPIDALRYE